MYWSNYFSFFYREKKKRKKSFPIDYVQLAKLELPFVIAKIDKNKIKDMLKDEFSIYSSLGYKKDDKKALNIECYHSYQIGVMLQFLKGKVDFFVADNQKVFPQSILNHNINSVKLNVGDIVSKYAENVSKLATEITLKQQTIWTPIEASFLLYYSTMVAEQD